MFYLWKIYIHTLYDDYYILEIDITHIAYLIYVDYKV